jgi:hypothetical protein
MSAQTRTAEPTAHVLRRLGDLEGFTVGTTDGDIGSVTDAYFEDDSWTVRYLVLDTGAWLPGRHVLLSPGVIDRVDADGRRLITRLGRAQVEAGPDVDTALPVARQKEVELALHFQYPYYWAGPLRWGAAPDVYGATPLLGAGAAPPPAGLDRAAADEMTARLESENAHLRSAHEVRGYAIQATDGELGEVEDFLFDDGTWTIRYLEVDPARWWPSAHVVLATEWVRDIDWAESKVHVELTREAVRNAPRYEPGAAVEREWETRLHEHYGRRGYWEETPERWRTRSR